MNRLSFRSGRPHEAGLFNEMTMAGVKWHQHGSATPELLAGLEAQLEVGKPGEVIQVGEFDGRIVGFYGLCADDGIIELTRMFLRTDQIGKGYGTQLWDHAVTTAAATHERMKIVADPGARGFYESKGAMLEDELEPAPGFVLGVYWYNLP